MGRSSRPSSDGAASPLSLFSSGSLASAYILNARFFVVEQCKATVLSSLINRMRARIASSTQVGVCGEKNCKPQEDSLRNVLENMVDQSGASRRCSSKSDGTDLDVKVVCGMLQVGRRGRSKGKIQGNDSV